MVQYSCDLHLFESIQKGDKKVFDSFFVQYYPKLCAYASQFVSEEDAEEITQDVMVWLWENRKNIVVETSLSSYLFKAVRNKCLNSINKNKIKERVHLSVANSNQNLIDDPDFYIVEELTQKVEEALKRLPDTYREAFILSRIEGKTYKEVAGLLGVSSKTIDYRIQQSLKILRVELKDYLPLLLSFLGL